MIPGYFSSTFGISIPISYKLRYGIHNPLENVTLGVAKFELYKKGKSKRGKYFYLSEIMH